MFSAAKSGTVASAYTLNNSLRIRASASAYLNRTPASAGNRQKFTLSFWAKRGSLGSPQTILSGGATGGTGTAQFIGFDTNDTFFFSNFNIGNVQTTQVFRDPSAWYHIVVAVDTTQATAANRVIFYVNGVQVTSYSATTYPAQNTNLYINTNEIQTIGRTSYSALYYYDGYLTEYNFIDGQALTPSSFGSTNATTSVWQPARYTGSYGTNGFYLKFNNTSSTANLGLDSSGNSNTWTVNNLSLTAGTTYDAMIDSPTLTSATVANYCIANPLNKDSSVTVTDGNLAVSAGATNIGITGSIAISSGKWYWEVTQTAGGVATSNIVGITDATLPAKTAGLSTNSYGYGTGTTAYKWNAGTNTAYGVNWTNGDIIGVAFDADAGTLIFYKNNSSQGTAFTGISGTFYPAFGLQNTSAYAINFGQRPFSYTPPSGYVRLNAYNLPTSTIVQGNKYMDATLYTGNLTGQSITNAAAFKPDLVWIKSRSAATDNKLTDSVRGTTKAIVSNSTAAETTDVTGMTAFNTNGFTVGASTTYNNTSATYVGWQWQAGQGSSSSNTSGSITSTVSVNATAGFSTLTYTGTGANATVGHGLGVAPKMVITKNRGATSDWAVWHTSLTSGAYYLLLDTTAAQASGTTYWNSTVPTSSVFSVGTATPTNVSTNTYVAYCWAEIAGYSKFGSYVGNLSTDGPFVYLGFRPRWIMTKNVTTANRNWEIIDTSRDTYNVEYRRLFANASNAEDTGVNPIVDYLSNGFKLRTSDSAINGNGETYIYAAFAENPFKNALAR